MPPAFIPSNRDSHFVPSSASLRTVLQKRSEAIHQPPMEGNSPSSKMPPISNTDIRPQLARRNSRVSLIFATWRAKGCRTIYGGHQINNSVPGYIDIRRSTIRSTPCWRLNFHVWQWWVLTALLTGIRLSSHAAFDPIEKWTKVRHPGIVPLKEAFTTRGFKDDCKYTANDQENGFFYHW